MSKARSVLCKVGQTAQLPVGIRRLFRNRHFSRRTPQTRIGKFAIHMNSELLLQSRNRCAAEELIVMNEQPVTPSRIVNFEDVAVHLEPDLKRECMIQSQALEVLCAFGLLDDARGCRSRIAKNAD